ncbi:MAG TPA: zinc-binding dehydrogenase, partial [Vicinamibacterales bacterium]|nr:zinc-binding dehydrogenase [Vicinamibacterales bacterium]
ADYLVAPARQLLPVGDLDLVQAAPLTDAGLTPYHAVNICRDALVPGSTCVVIGVGGLGHMAIQILKTTTAARVIAVDVSDEALAMAASLGADHPIVSNPEAAGYIRDLVGPPPGGVDVVIDCVGRQSTLDLAAAVVTTGGQIAIVGLGGGAVPVAAGAHVPWEVRVTNPFWGTRKELAEVIALARMGRITAHVETFPLADASSAYERMRAGTLRGRAVILPPAGERLRQQEHAGARAGAGVPARRAT